MPPVRHIYVHVPFCRRRCVYCDFSIAVRNRIPAERYGDAVWQEYRWRRAHEQWRVEGPDTLYLGGGTPSLLPPPQVARLAAALAAPADRARGKEFTIEVNPEDVSADTAAIWHDIGVNRVSLGVQSFDGSVLEWMHRGHDAEMAERAVRILRDAGIAAISLDLIFAVPAGCSHRLRDDLARVVELAPDHVSVYGLTVEPGTPLGHRVARGQVEPLGESRYEREFLLAHEVLSGVGFEHYEVSNYAMPGCRSRHNSAYWLGAPYLGLGPSAHGFTGRDRLWNVPAWTAYERTVALGGDPTESHEQLTEEQRRLERTYLGLRTLEGIETALLPESAALHRDAAVRRGWLELRGGRVHATPGGWLRLDALVHALTTSP